MRVREFEKHDWYGFAGCVEWPDGSQPLIGVGTLATGKEYVVVFDPTGCCLVVEDHEASEAGGWILAMPFPTQKAACAFAAGVSEPGSLEDLLRLGFRLA